MDLKEKLKTQLSEKAADKPNVQNDPRFHGLSRIYFFRRLSDDHIFPIDSELQASHLMRRKDFKFVYEFIGWSKGTHFNTLKNKPPRRVKMDDEMHVTPEGEKVVEGYREEYNEAMMKEFEEAVDNQDKTPPRDFRTKGLNGQIADTQLTSWLKMMP